VHCRSRRTYFTDHSSPSSSVLCCRLYLPPAVLETCFPMSFSRCLLPVFFGGSLLLWPSGVHCNACLAMLPSFLLSVSKPVPFPSSELDSSTGSWSAIFYNSFVRPVNSFLCCGLYRVDLREASQCQNAQPCMFDWRQLMIAGSGSIVVYYT